MSLKPLRQITADSQNKFIAGPLIINASLSIQVTASLE